MPFSPDFAAERIGPPDTGRIRIFSSVQTSGPFKGKEIPLDGRRYIVEGKVSFKNGITLSAKFDLDTTHFDLLVLNSLKVFKDALWYMWYEKELVTALGAENSDDILPFLWTPTVPLKYRLPPPYPMRFHQKHVDEILASIRLLHNRGSLPLDDAKALLFFDPVHWH
jgi:hypothetical protein